MRCNVPMSIRWMSALLIVGAIGSIEIVPVSAQVTNNSTSNRSLGNSITAGSRTAFGSNAPRGGAGSASSGQIANGIGAQMADGTVTGNERFIQANRQGKFVGGDSADTVNVYRGTGQQNRGGQQGGLEGLLQAMSNRNQQPNAGQGASQMPVRPTYVAAFKQPLPSASILVPKLDDRLKKAFPTKNDFQVEVQGRSVTLRGTAPSEHERHIAELLVGMEPGVSSVKNEIVVVALPPTE